jgi:hypothetical protein
MYACGGIHRCAGEWRKPEMVSAYMPLQRLMLAEGLITRWIFCASEPFVAFMRSLVSP